MIEADRAAWAYWLDMLAGLLSPVFAQASSRRAAWDYVRALLRVTERRSCWQLAELSGHRGPRRLQGLLCEYVWDAGALVARVRELVVARLGDPEAVLAIDETAELKSRRGRATVGVARQYAGVTGQVENCQTVVFLSYVAAWAHALIDFALYLPKQWADDLERRRGAGVPDEVTFATKPALAVRLLRRAVDAATPFAWVVADEVYGRASELRAYIESIARGYVLAIPVNFMVTACEGAEPCTVEQAARLVPDTAWEERSCGKGCQGHRYYQWALLATASPTHHVLLRRHPDRPDQVTYFYVFVPPQRQVTLATIVKIAGRRWPVEECFQQGKGQAGLDQHQVRTWRSWHRHTALCLAALSILALASASPRPDHTDEPAPPGQDDPAGQDGASQDPTGQPATPRRPAHWADTGVLPTHPGQDPPEQPGLVKVSVPEARRLLNIATSALSRAQRELHQHWSTWRRRHQARARWHHYHKRLTAAVVTT
jgi:SRSO17 transposase